MQRFFGILGLLALLAAVAPARADTLYGATGTSSGTGTLVIINPVDGTYTTVGAINDALGNNYRVTGLAFDPFSGVLYGSTSRQSPTASSSLITINPTTAQATLVGSYGLTFGNETMADLTFRPNGTLYGWSEPGTDSLYTINTTTGAATLVGPSGLATAGSGLAFDSSGTLFFAGDGSSGALRTIDPNTGAPTFVANLSGGNNLFGRINALDFDSTDTLFGVEGNPFLGTPHYLVSIDTNTGAITTRGQSIDRLDAIAFQPAFAPSAVPEPSSMISLAAGGAALLGYVRRRRNRNKTA